ncbi:MULTISPECIES: ExeA family protein [unclassified Thioalkalivibrio]|uniref:ExeA family protein n=1 Tax=unclassified Thioalkalivibrio TaxID=2621013 RepID=UPI00037C3EE1|nr:MULTISPECIES: AAA family ATPase [unclassified Thioalkalivibrio]
MSAHLYLEHFGLEEPPFRLTPATRFLYLGESMREALNTACLGLDSGDAFLKITGQVGLGKTLVCRELLNRLEAPFETAYIPNPRLPPNELLSAIARELAIETPEGSPGADHLMSRIQDRLLERAAAGARVVLLLDEAQTMPDETVETVRLLTNLESASERLLQLVLLGQPELDERLAAHHLRQIRSRITHACTLRPLAVHEVVDYLRFRQIVAGRHAGDLFTETAARRLARHSGGVPRLLNILAHKALLDAFGRGDGQARRAHVARAARDTEEARRDARALPWLAAAIAGSAAGAGLWYSGLLA